VKGGDLNEEDCYQKGRNPQGYPDEIGRCHVWKADPLQVVAVRGVKYICT